MTELYAIELCRWLTVEGISVQPVAPSVTPDGQPGIALIPEFKTFCSTQCLEEFIHRKNQEYLDAEFKVLTADPDSPFDRES